MRRFRTNSRLRRERDENGVVWPGTNGVAVAEEERKGHMSDGAAV